jgi:hypothetical protein
MHMNDLWESAKLISIQTGKDIVGGFDVGFDDEIPEATRDELMQFVYWVEDNYSLPVTLWVDFKYRNYLVDDSKKRVGYKCYWVDFATFPVFDNFDDIPVIELPVRLEKWTMDEILTSFIEAISHYFAWLSNLDVKNFTADPALTEKILQTYKTRGE